VGWNDRDDAVEALKRRRTMAVGKMQAAIRRQSGESIQEAVIEYVSWFRTCSANPGDGEVENQLLEVLAHTRLVWEDSP
jgi:hypothetical protein